MRITEAAIKRAEKNQLDDMLFTLGMQAYKMYSRARDKEKVWFNQRFESLRRRFVLAYEMRYYTYEWFDGALAYDAFNCFIY